jgi:hypothetical protein
MGDPHKEARILHISDPFTSPGPPRRVGITGEFKSFFKRGAKAQPLATPCVTEMACIKPRGPLKSGPGIALDGPHALSMGGLPPVNNAD